VFHAITRRWFEEALGQPTAAQEQGWAAIAERRHTLIAAPTGSGKTLAAFLTALDDLLQEGLASPLPDEVRVVYVSPLKALSADIHKNLAEPRIGLRRVADEMGIVAPRITAAVRTGDTTSSERAAMLRTPPHILVTTPESLYLLLTAERSREMLRSVRTVIVDEIHAVIGTRRGAHLSLTLERLAEVAEQPLLRLGLSATQKPIEEVARYLTGGAADCAIVNEGHRRAMDLTLETPLSQLETVMSHEVWEDYYNRLTELIEQHRTTLVFVNTRRMAERVARHLSDRLGDEAVTAHHGSLSKENRLNAESRLKNGQLKALVATASLELGIDIGHVDLVCQLGSPHRIATLLQRVGRSGHTVSGLPKGRIFPVSRDDLVECAALLRAVRRGELDRIVTHDAPLDVLAQQLVAESACCDYDEETLFTLVRRAWPYRNLARADFDKVLTMVSDGFATKRGRRAALVHRDEVNGHVKGRRGARMLAITSGGAIPEIADYRVILEGEETFIGTLNEDFAIESNAGDIFQLGNASWQITQVGSGVVRVADAHGAPPTIPFWLGEAPARSDELSLAVSQLRADFELVAEPDPVAWLIAETGIPENAAQEIVNYLTESRLALGVLPTQETLVLERFFDESGGMQLVLHAPFGSRVNKAWGLALRKRFCRQFNFELQAAATEDALLLSLGPQHSFPLADVFRYLHPATSRDVLVQAFLDAPVFQTRWRWDTTISLAVPRNRGGRKIPPQLQRTMADDLMAAVFPDAAACFENIAGDRQLPDHPLVNQAVRDCLEEAMDFESLAAILTRIHAGEIRCIARDTTEPSPLAHDILNAKPYAFLDDAPLEERRTQAVWTRRTGDTASNDGLGALDVAAIERVRDEERPDPRDADELHDALLTFGFLTDEEVETPALLQPLIAAKRVARVRTLWIAAERIPEIVAVHPDVIPPIAPPPSRATRVWTREEAIVELLRGRLSFIGPTTAQALASSIAITERDAESALITLETEGAVLRGRFEGVAAGASPAEAAGAAASTQNQNLLEWCDRRLLARIHRYTLNRLRAEIEPVGSADFMRFLFAWQHVSPSARLSGTDGLQSIVAKLDGFELAANAWERSVLPLRMDRYDASMLDALCLAGEVGWARLSPATTSGSPVGATPVALFLRDHAPSWRAMRESADLETTLSDTAKRIVETLRSRGASFPRDLGIADEELQRALGELVSAGLIASDGFAGLRGLVDKRARTNLSGRWSLLTDESTTARDAAVEAQARVLLQRYGVVFRRLLTREPNAAPWRELARIYRRLEARGEIRGGRFVAGMSGEQFALPDAVEKLREIRRTAPDGQLIVISAADPLNLIGILTTAERIRAIPSTRIAFRDGIAVSVMEGDCLRPIAELDDNSALQVAAALAGRRVSVASGFVGR
jgi:ATP-dependent Lhr-like helicase